METNFPVSKQDWRRFLKQKLLGIPEEKRQIKQSLFQRQLAPLLEEKRGVWGAYLAMPEELNLEGLISELSSMDWVFPRVEAGGLVFYRSQRFERSDFGILEPVVGFGSERVPDLAFQGFLVPGLGFDVFGGRIGRGKGYYDRFLGRFETVRPVKIGVGYSEQVMGVSLPMTGQDIRMDLIVSDDGVWRV